MEWIICFSIVMKTFLSFRHFPQNKMRTSKQLKDMMLREAFASKLKTQKLSKSEKGIMEVRSWVRSARSKISGEAKNTMEKWAKNVKPKALKDGERDREERWAARTSCESLFLKWQKSTLCLGGFSSATAHQCPLTEKDVHASLHREPPPKKGLWRLCKK